MANILFYLSFRFVDCVGDSDIYNMWRDYSRPIT